MKIRVGIWKILREMTTNIAIFSAFIAYNAGKRNWDGVWILIGALIFVIIAVYNTFMQNRAFSSKNSEKDP